MPDTAATPRPPSAATPGDLPSWPADAIACDLPLGANGADSTACPRRPGLPGSLPLAACRVELDLERHFAPSLKHGWAQFTLQAQAVQACFTRPRPGRPFCPGPRSHSRSRCCARPGRRHAPRCAPRRPAAESSSGGPATRPVTASQANRTTTDGSAEGGAGLGIDAGDVRRGHRPVAQRDAKQYLTRRQFRRTIRAGHAGPSARAPGPVLSPAPSAGPTGGPAAWPMRRAGTHLAAHGLVLCASATMGCAAATGGPQPARGSCLEGPQ